MAEAVRFRLGLRGFPKFMLVMEKYMSDLQFNLMGEHIGERLSMSKYLNLSR